MKVLYRKDPTKPPVVAARRHATLNSFRKASKQNEISSSAPLAEQSQLHGARFDEYEFMREGKRHIRLSGREFLTPIGNVAATTVSNAPAGYRFAVVPLSPAALGGRLALMAEQFQFNRGKKFKLIYEPVVPATTTGAIAMYFNNDIGTPLGEVGDDELAHAATHEYFAQTAVWSPIMMDIEPEDAVTHYVDQESGDARFEIQGIIVIEAASILDIPAGFTFGNLYLEYEVEFSVESLDYSVTMREEGVMSVTTVVGTPTAGTIIQFGDGAATAAIPSYAVTMPTGVIAAELEDWVFVATVVQALNQWVSGNNTYAVEGDSTTYTWLGSGAVLRFTIGSTGVVYASLFSSLTAASTSSVSAYPQTGQLDWPAGMVNFTAGTDLILRGYWHPRAPSTGA